MELTNVILPFQDSLTRWDITTSKGLVSSISPSNSPSSSPPSLILPSLCHAHIHLDKPYLFTCNHSPSFSHPDYSDLAPQSGSFSEALKNTSAAKARFTSEDLLLRGSQLLASSYSHGVTSIRAFVEVDQVVGTKTLEAAIQLKQKFSHLIHVQICAFAQDPIFSTENGELNRAILSAALEDFAPWIDVLGTTPYVERTEEAGLQNIRWAIDTALQRGLHLDFHIEYNLDADEGGSLGHIDDVLDFLAVQNWPTGEGTKTVVLGHATRLSTASHSTVARLAERIRKAELPVYFVGLPTSDLYMMGRPSSEESSLSRLRGTLNVPLLIREYGLSACLAVNNVGNAFTPYGNGDPLALASWGVGLYHAGSVDDAKLLYECMSTRAREAIGLGESKDDSSWEIAEGKAWPPMLLVQNGEDVRLPGMGDQDVMLVEARRRLDIKDVVWDPPESCHRRVLH